MKVMKNRQKYRSFLLFVSFMLFPATYYYFSPYLPFMGAAEGVLNGSMVVFALLFLGSLFGGRLFCGWLCPAGGLQHCAAGFRNKAVNRKRLRWIKWVLWAVWFGLYLFVLISGGGPGRIDFFFQTEMGLSISNVGSLVLYLMIAFLFLLLPLTAGRRAACHTICWMAPFMVAGRKLGNISKWPALKLKTETGNCISCGLCTSCCPMSIDVMKNVLNGNMEDQDCILCGECADSCPKKVISFGLGAG